jgi:hypothetical protein
MTVRHVAYASRRRRRPRGPTGSLGWAAVAAAAVAGFVSLVGNGALTWREVAAVRDAPAASPTPSAMLSTPPPASPKASPSPEQSKKSKEPSAPAAPYKAAAPTPTQTKTTAPVTKKKSNSCSSGTTKATTGSTTRQDFSRPVGQIVGLSGKCIQLVGSALQMYDCNGASDQQWRFAANGTLQKGGRCLSLVSRSTNDGIPVVMTSCDTTNVTQWRVSPNADIVNVAADKCLDVSGANTANGTPLQTAWCSGNSAQKWTVP